MLPDLRRCEITGFDDARRFALGLDQSRRVNRTPGVTGPRRSRLEADVLVPESGLLADEPEHELAAVRVIDHGSTRAYPDIAATAMPPPERAGALLRSTSSAPVGRTSPG